MLSGVLFSVASVFGLMVLNLMGKLITNKSRVSGTADTDDCNWVVVVTLPLCMDSSKPVKI